MGPKGNMFALGRFPCQVQKTDKEIRGRGLSVICIECPVVQTERMPLVSFSGAENLCTLYASTETVKEFCVCFPGLVDRGQSEHVPTNTQQEEHHASAHSGKLEESWDLSPALSPYVNIGADFRGSWLR